LSALLLSASDVRGSLDRRALLESLREAMKAYASGTQPRAKRTHSAIPARAPHSVMIVFPGFVPGIPAYTVKINAKLPQSVPSVRGLISLHDLETGTVLAVMDSIAITAIRTALVGALAADALARESIRTVAVIGAGVQGREQLRALRLLRTFDSVRVFDTHPERAAALIDEMRRELEVEFTHAKSVGDAVQRADVVVTATWAKHAFLTRAMITPGAHITAIGADEPGKAELDRELLQAATFVCDDPDLAVEMGALAGVGLGHDAIHASLGEVLSGAKSGRTNDDEITVFGSVGLACQDLPAAWMAYQKAVESRAAVFDFHGDERGKGESGEKGKG
jgi:ornithine cyclodeaminase/alanine dehydrogenase-like protein (mu-crystallin family)